MIFSTRKLLLLLATPLLTQCGSKSAPPSQTVTGPFNSRGDYIEDWVDQPDKWYRPPAPGTGSGSKPKTAIASNTQVAPEPHVPLIETYSPPEPRPQPTVAKPKPTSKPKPPTVIRHTVKRGDTLSALARRYGTSVTKIQKANGLPNTVIRLGQTLKIPK